MSHFPSYICCHRAAQPYAAHAHGMGPRWRGAGGTLRAFVRGQKRRRIGIPAEVRLSPFQAHPEMTVAAMANQARKKILLVDDSATTHMWIGMIMNKSEYQLVSARDGQQGVETALAELPDLILMDVVMPRMDGFEACRRLREHHSTRTTPIIMVTTRAEAKNVETGFTSGCSDYITKPIDGLELLSKVRSFLGE
jgi:PleD family two-component response regulator